MLEATIRRALDIVPRPRGHSISVADRWSAHLAAACGERDISTPERIAAFLAQLAHESGGFARTEEFLAYSAERLLQVFPSRVTEAQAVRLADQGPRAIANHVYARANGNRGGDDGWNYRGRGLIQLTGRGNYREAGAAIGRDLEREPELAARENVAAAVAAWFWRSRGCNELADANAFTTITRRINGGTNGLADRKHWWRRFRRALGLTEQPQSETAAPARAEQAEAPRDDPTPRRVTGPALAGTAGGAGLLASLGDYLPYLSDVSAFIRDNPRVFLAALAVALIATAATWYYRRRQSQKAAGMR